MENIGGVGWPVEVINTGSDGMVLWDIKVKMQTGQLDVQVCGAGLKFLQKKEVYSGKHVLMSFIEMGGAFYGGQLE